MLVRKRGFEFFIFRASNTKTCLLRDFRENQSLAREQVFCYPMQDPQAPNGSKGDILTLPKAKSSVVKIFVVGILLALC
jgi:hypothetical protein